MDSRDKYILTLSLGEWLGALDRAVRRHDRLAANALSATQPTAQNVLVEGEQTYNFQLLSEADAKRFEYAAEFLRAACDNTGETGF